MDIFSRMVDTQSLLFVFILLGVAIRKAGIITRQSRDSYNRFLLTITLPAMILNSFNGTADAAALAQAGLIFAVSAGVCLFSYGLGRLIWRGQPPGRFSPLLFGTMFSNAGNAGMPVVQLVFGQEGLLFASLYLIPIRVLMWTLGLSLFMTGHPQHRWRTLLLTPSVVVVFAGLVMMVTGLRLPGFLGTAVRKVGDITGPLSMILIGTTLAEMDLRRVLCREALLLSLLRLAALPLLTLGLLIALRAEPLVLQVAFVLCAMPAATNTVVLAERYGADYHLASQCVFLSTALSLVTVPLLTLLL